MARYQLILAYDGTNFFGFQRQGRRRTVQLEIEAALRELGWQGKTLLAAGRTDSGVHAEGQVVAFDLDWRHTPQELGRALNAHLPEDVAVRDVLLTSPDFHPRYDAVARCYEYHIYCEPQRNPLYERYAWRVWPAVDRVSLQASAQLFGGTHDFAAFGTPPRTGGSTRRTILAAGWRQVEEQHLLFEVSADAFLYHMVRRMVFVQVAVAQGKINLKELEMAIYQVADLPPGLAPAKGLVLKRVIYPDS